MRTEVVRISPAEAHEKMTREGFTYVDVRSPAEFAAGHPAGALNIPLDDAFADTMLSRFPTDARLVVGCQTGIRSVRAARALLGAGFTNVVEQRAGFDGARGPFGEMAEPGWSRVGLPVER